MVSSVVFAAFNLGHSPGRNKRANCSLPGFPSWRRRVVRRDRDNRLWWREMKGQEKVVGPYLPLLASQCLRLAQGRDNHLTFWLVNCRPVSNSERDTRAQVIVIPEKIAILLDSELPEADPLLQSTATKTGALIVAGVIHPTTGAKWNEARLYFPDGAIRTYEKHHMLPVYEGKLTVGTARTEWQEPSGLWGITICKDMDFPQLSRDYGNDGVGLLLVPAWDFGVDGWWHGRMAILRGVESGFSIARAPKEGILSVSDNRGRVLAERSTDTAPFAALVATVPVQHEPTLYDRFGNWLGWLNLAVLLLLVTTPIRNPQAADEFTTAPSSS